MKTVKPNSPRAWLLAARPKTLTGAAIPVLAGISLASMNINFSVTLATLCFLFACGMQISANLINDLFDYLKGSDREDRLGPKRACAQGWISPKCMKAGVAVAITLSCIAGLAILYICFGSSPYGGWELIAIGVLCVIFAFLYTTILSYQGWGDVLVLIFFGFVPVCGTFYVQTFSITPSALIASVICGLTIDTLLVVNNYRDREQDAISGKRTLVVRFGETFGKYLYLILGIIAACLCMWFVKLDNLLESILPFFYLYAHIVTWKRMKRIGKGKELNEILSETSRNMLIMGILLSVMILV